MGGEMQAATTLHCRPQQCKCLGRGWCLQGVHCPPFDLAGSRSCCQVTSAHQPACSASARLDQ